MALVGGCSYFFPERAPFALNPAEARRITFDVVARDNRCEPSVLALDREGRSVLVTFEVTSVGKEHYFLIPGLAVRRQVAAGTTLSIQVLADRSGVFEIACNSQPWIGPFATKGKLAIK
jgi:hypothetical protein